MLPNSFPLPRDLQSLFSTLRRLGVPPTRFLLTINVSRQTLSGWERQRGHRRVSPFYLQILECRVSTSKFGIGQLMNSNCTPLGLHRIARKIGGGQPQGTAFRGRVPVGLTWQGLPDASIVHRILWLEGLEPGFNRGGNVDSFRRYIYIHGFSDETTIGRPVSQGCIHLAAADIISLYDWLPVGTLVWIHEKYSSGRDTRQLAYARGALRYIQNVRKGILDDVLSGFRDSSGLRSKRH